MSPQVVHHYYLARTKTWNQRVLYISLEDFGGGCSSTTSEGPIPSVVMLESSVVFLPRLRGTDNCSLSPLGA